MKVLSVRQPWAWALIFGGKEIENRFWKTKYRGLIAIHASKGMTCKEYELAKEYMLDIIPCVPNFDELDRGAIIGTVNLVDITQNTGSPWFMGSQIGDKQNYGGVVEKPNPRLPVKFKGGLGLRDLPSWMDSLFE